MNALQLQLEGVFRPHRNQQLFSDHFLNRRLPATPAWSELRDEAQAVFEKLVDLHEARAAVLPKLGEMQLEETFVRPVLRALGHTFQVQAKLQTSQGIKRPDYVLFAFQAAADKYAGCTLTDTILRDGGLAVADAKAWGRSLDAPLTTGGGGSAFGDPFAAANPSAQIHFYIEQSGLPWGILTDGRFWRLYHRETAHKLDRFYEVDLPALLEARRVDDFLYFYAFFRRAAFDAGPISLDAVLGESVEYAQGVGESLKEQVYAALRLVAQGFLDSPRNRLRATPVTLSAIYDNSLVVLYRLLFVLYAEARGLLPLRENQRYREDYSLHAIKRDVARRLDEGRGRQVSSALLWRQLQELFALIDRGDPPLQIATFNGGLFDPAKHPFLDQYDIADRHLERALDLIARVGGEFVDYRDLATRHLGTIYEGLLEYHLEPLTTPEPDGAGGVFTTALLNDKGERKSSGSFYTPDYIVEHIVREALAPVVTAAVQDFEEDSVKAAAVLRLNVLDPAMGSAHFLVEATEYLARYLAGLNVDAADLDLPTGEVVDVSFWKRRVAQACIYGVDLNPLAVELGKLSLWLTTAAKDRPLSFLDHHLRCGNSLVGARLAGLRAAHGMGTRTKRRKVDDGTQTSFLDTPAFRQSIRDAVVSMEAIEASPGLTVADVKAQEQAYLTLHEKLVERFGRPLDVVTASQYGLAMDPGLRRVLLDATPGSGVGRVPQAAAYLKRVGTMRKRVGFFHWEIEFPSVFFNVQGESLGEQGGFDAVVGNPPYDVLAAKERGEPVARVQEFLEYAKQDAVLAPVLGRKVDLFRLFLAQALALGHPGAAAGFIVPMSLLADQQAATLRAHIFSKHAIRSIHAFPQKDDPRRRVFPEAKLPTCVIALCCQIPSDDGFTVTVHPGRHFEEVTGRYETSWQAVRTADAESLTIPLLASSAASKLAEKLAKVPGACRMGDLFTSYQGEINETTMDELLSTDPATGTKILRGSNIRRYRVDPDARQGVDKYLDVDAYRISTGGARAADTERQRFGYQRNAALDSSRRLLFAELPNPSFCFDSISYIPIDGTVRPYAWLALLNSDLLEWVFRLTSTNNHVSTDQVHKLPALRPGPGTRKTPDKERLQFVKRALEVSDDAARTKEAPVVIAELARALAGKEPATDAAVDVLDALGRAMLKIEQARVDAIEACWLDLEGVLSPAATRRLSRLWTPLRLPSNGASEDARKRHSARTAEAEAVLGPLAGQILPFEAMGFVNEEQWKWLVLQRLPRLPGLHTVVNIFRQHQPTIGALHLRASATDWMINRIVYAAFRVTEEEIALVEQAIRRPQHPAARKSSED